MILLDDGLFMASVLAIISRFCLKTAIMGLFWFICEIGPGSFLGLGP
jgi:hypothetical protein